MTGVQLSRAAAYVATDSALELCGSAWVQTPLGFRVQGLGFRAWGLGFGA